MDTTTKYKIFNIDNEGMSEMFSKIFWQIREANNDIIDQQNEIIRAANDLYIKFNKEYKKLNRQRAYFGRISEMDLEEEAFNYAMSKTVTFFKEFNKFGSGFVDSFLNIVTGAPKSFFNAVKDVLGEEK